MKLLNAIKNPQFSAVFSALLYALCIPCAKILGQYVPSVLMGGLLYLGAGFGLIFLGALRAQNPLTKKEMPFAISMGLRVPKDCTNLSAFL